MRGTILNVGTVLAGSTAGALFGGALSRELQSTLTDCIGLITLLIGAKMAVRTRNVLLVLAAVLLGAVLGEILRLDAGLRGLAHWFDEASGGAPAGGGDFASAVLTPTLLFCVGPITLMGCLEDGLSDRYTLLATKSVMDGFSAMAFAAALGWRVAFSALPVFLIQGTLTLGARRISRVLSPPMTRELFATGGILLLGLGLNLLGLKTIPIPNLLPALILAPAFAAPAARAAARAPEGS